MITITANQARELEKYYELSYMSAPGTTQAIFFPCSSNFEKEKQFESCKSIVDNSYILARFKFSNKEQEKFSKDLPKDITADNGGYLLLYVPFRKPTFKEIEEFKIVMNSFLSGYKCAIKHKRNKDA